MQDTHNTEKPIILFDIDNTLLDTKKFVTQVFEQVRQLFELTQADFVAQKDAFYQTLAESTDFTPEAFVDFIAESNRSESELADAEKMVKAVSYFYDDGALTNALFEDVVPNLERLSVGHTLGIFSQGDKKYQLKKIENSGLISFFDQRYMFIEKRKTTPEYMQQLPAHVTIVDDRLDVIAALQANPFCTPVLLQRQQNESLEIEEINTTVIHSLSELA